MNPLWLARHCRWSVRNRYRRLRWKLLLRLGRDPLTGLQRWTRMQRVLNRSAGAALLIDVDFQKQYNLYDSLTAGDALLIRLARLVKQATAASPPEQGRRRRLRVHCYRLGGDEFAVLLPSRDLDRAAAIAEALRAQIASEGIELLPADEEPLPLISSSRRLTVTIAVLDYPRHADLHHLAAAAEELLGRGKQTRDVVVRAGRVRALRRAASGALEA